METEIFSYPGHVALFLHPRGLGTKLQKCINALKHLALIGNKDIMR